MLKNNLKLHDTFLVSVEILSANAIIVSANIDSIIYRGALLQCNTSEPYLFKNNKNKPNCFTTQRVNITESKKNVRLKSFNSNYNLRQANQKITKAKKIVCKSELKGVIDDITNNANTIEPLSIKLKRLNGIYQNVEELKKDSIDDKCLKRKFCEDDSENTPIDHKRNIIKIKKIKLHSDQYHYSISTDEINNESNYLPRLFDNIAQVSLSPLRCNSTNIIQTSLPDATQTPDLFSSSVDFSIESISDQTQDDVGDFITISSNSSDITQRDSQIQRETTSVIDPVASPCNSSITKLKIIKNQYNSYAIKSADKNEDSSNRVLSRYNCKEFRKNDIIWAKLAGYSIWPAKVLDTDGNDHVTVMWLGSGQRTSKLHKQKLWDFGAHFHEKFNRKAKGSYLDAVEQARIDYGKLDFRDSYQCTVDLSSESSTLGSVNIDDSSFEFDRGSVPDLRTNVYLPVADEEFELSRPSDVRRSRLRAASFLVDSPDPRRTTVSDSVVTDMNI